MKKRLWSVVLTGAMIASLLSLIHISFDEKYGFRDYRGGGRSSGRETIGRVAAGAVAAKLLGSLGVQVMACLLYTSPQCRSPPETCR